MKVKVLNQMAMQSLGYDDEGVVSVPDAAGKSLIEAGYAEAVTEKKVERATKAPDETKSVPRKATAKK